jgi:hypothetical protein
VVLVHHAWPTGHYHHDIEATGISDVEVGILCPKRFRIGHKIAPDFRGYRHGLSKVGSEKAVKELVKMVSNFFMSVV